MENAPQFMGVREFARFIGRSPAAVAKMLKGGRIPRGDDGKIPVQAALLALESVETSKPWAHVAAHAAAKKKSAALRGDAEEAPQDCGEAPEDGGGNLHGELIRAKIRGQELVNATREIELQKRRGALIPIEEALEYVTAIGNALAACFRSLPWRTAPACEGKTADEIADILEDAVQWAFGQVQKLESPFDLSPLAEEAAEGVDGGKVGG